MQYKNYEIQITDYACIIRDEKGEYIISTSTDREAKEYIDDINEDQYTLNEEIPINWYERFDQYCKNLPGKCYIEGKIATTYEKILEKFAKSFENATNTTVTLITKYMCGEYIAFVESVEHN